MKFYNYAYIDTSVSCKLETDTVCFIFLPLYVGKGQKKRYLHGSRALDKENHLLTNKRLYCKLRSLQKRGFTPEIILFNQNSTLESSLDVEAKIIETLGRKNIDSTGILLNIAKGGEIPDTTGVSPPIKGKKLKEYLTPERYLEVMKILKAPKDKTSIDKMVQTRRQNNTYHTGEKHPRARKLKAISPAGQIFTLNGNLKRFCEQNDLKWQSLYRFLDKGPVRVKQRTASLQTKNTEGWQLVSG